MAMVDFRLLVSDPKNGKTFQKVLKPEEARHFIGTAIGQVVRGEAIGLSGYELLVMGGSDKDGFPMRSDLEGSAKRQLLLASGTGYHPKEEGVRKRRTIRGKVVGDDTAQLNTKIVKRGKTNLEEVFGKKAEGEAKPEEK